MICFLGAREGEVNDFTKDSKNPVELKEYEYQDNIIEIIEQENIVEELESYTEICNAIITHWEPIQSG